MFVKKCLFFNISDIQPAIGEQTTLYTYTGPDFAFNPIALRKVKIVYNFGLSECNRVKK